MGIAVKVGSLDLSKSDDDFHVRRVEVAEALDELDAVTVEFFTRPTEIGGAWTKVQPGTAMTVTLKSDDGSVTETTKAIVVSVEIEADDAVGYRVVVTGLEDLVKLRGSASEVAWEDAPDKIAKAIVQAGGLTPQADGSDVLKYRVDQTGLDDVVMLKLIADRFHYRVGTADGKIVFKRRSVAASTVTIPADDILGQRIGASVHRVVTESIVWGRDPKEKGWFQEKITDTGRGISGTITALSLAKKVFKAAKVELTDAGCANPGAAKERATAELKRRAETFVDGRIVVRGNPKVKCGVDVDLQGEIWPFKGKYRVREVRHVDGDGDTFRTIIDVYSDSLPAKS